jgi:TPR repeat protein
VKRLMNVSLFLLGLNAFACLPAFADSPAQTPAAPANEKMYWNSCIEGLEHILPGDFYACRARYYFQRDHNLRGVSELEEAAYWASKEAQYTLGLIYFNGDMKDVSANRPLALAWLALAAERNDATHQQAYAIARAKSSDGEIQASEALLKKMKLKYADKVAGVRAMRRFNHEIAPLEDAANTGGIVYLRGYSPFPEEANSVVSQLHAEADKAFQGLIGTVTVGPLQVR